MHTTTIRRRIALTASAAAAAIILASCSSATSGQGGSAEPSGAEQGAAAIADAAQAFPTGTAQGGVTTPIVDTATVTRVIDGDTVIATTEDGDELRVRILGIDSPESVHPDQPVECWGPESSAWATDVLDGQTVTLRTDTTQDETDRYDRALRYVEMPDGTDYSVLAAREGMADRYVVGDTPPSKIDQIDDAAAEAHEAGRGLWGACR